MVCGVDPFEVPLQDELARDFLLAPERLLEDARRCLGIELESDAAYVLEAVVQLLNSPSTQILAQRYEA